MNFVINVNNHIFVKNEYINSRQNVIHYKINKGNPSTISECLNKYGLVNKDEKIY